MQFRRKTFIKHLDTSNGIRLLLGYQTSYHLLWMLAISLPLSLIVLLYGLQYDSHIVTAVSIFAAMLLVMLPEKLVFTY